GIDYEIRISSIGFNPVIYQLSKENNVELDFKLISDEVVLDEAIILKAPPIQIKKDTVIFDVKSFAKGDENKLKEILEKLPGMEVDKDGRVTYNGKIISNLMVEDKQFFGGNVKLGSDNIPANALDKIEVLDSYNEVGFLKDVSDSEQVAMNI